MEPPPGPYAWMCLVCSTSNAAGSLQCIQCGCPDRVNGRELTERQRQFAVGQPYDGAHRGKPKSRVPGRRLDGSNTVPLVDLVRAAFGVVALIFALYEILASGHSRVSLSRHSTAVDIHDTLALTVIAIGYVGLLVWAVATVADHFDRRPNEPIYRWVSNLSVGIGFPCLVLGIVIEISSR